MAAVQPAGPEPMMTVLCGGGVSGMRPHRSRGGAAALILRPRARAQRAAALQSPQMPQRPQPKTFVRFARSTAAALGHPAAFGAAAAIVLVWVCLGPVFHYSNTWQMVINTATTIVTFLMVFLIQNTQNRQDDALQLKLDEIIRALGGAHNRLVDLEDVPDEELREIKDRFHKLAEDARRQAEAGRPDTESPEIDAGVPAPSEAVRSVRDRPKGGSARRRRGGSR